MHPSQLPIPPCEAQKLVLRDRQMAHCCPREVKRITSNQEPG